MKKFKGKDLVKIGFPEGKAIGLAIKVIEQHLAARPAHDVRAIMKKLVQYPESFLDDVIMAPIRSGLGLRFGANIGYLRFSPQPTWNPF